MLMRVSQYINQWRARRMLEHITKSAEQFDETSIKLFAPTFLLSGLKATMAREEKSSPEARAMNPSRPHDDQMRDRTHEIGSRFRVNNYLINQII